MLLVLFACASAPATHSGRSTLASKEPNSVPCRAEAEWVRAAEMAPVRADAGISLVGTSTSRCEVRLELRAADGSRVVGVTLSGAPSEGATVVGRAATTASPGSLELWHAAIGPEGSTASFTWSFDVSHPE